MTTHHDPPTEPVDGPDTAPPNEAATWWRRPRLRRRGRVVGGVASGLADAIAVDPLIVRVAFVVLMFAVHQLQLLQERLVLETKTYCDRQLIRHMRVR